VNPSLATASGHTTAQGPIGSPAGLGSALERPEFRAIAANPVALRKYQSVGFNPEGILSERFGVPDDAYNNGVVMGCPV